MFRFAFPCFCAKANRLPGLQSSKQNLEDENKVYDGMMLDLIRLLVLPPLTGCPPDQGLFEVSVADSTIYDYSRAAVGGDVHSFHT